jgi:hypothetical protein
MGRVFAHSAEVHEELSACLTRFFESDDGAAAVAAAAGLDVPAVLELRIVDPDTVLYVDFRRRRLVEAPVEQPGATAVIHADALHHLLLDHLGPVEISRLAEEGEVDLVGPPLVLGALLPLCAGVQPHYGASLEQRGRGDLLAVPPPPRGEVWESDSPPPGVIGVRRPWQRPRGRASAGG